MAKIGNQYNLNIYNGLSSNHIYNVMKDRYGYLWIATDDGVLKYDGYQVKLFNLSNGLSNADVWTLFEDKGGRIWLGSIADEIGYIYKDKYFKAKFPNFHHTIYPFDISSYKDQIIFSTPYVINIERSSCIIEHDTVFPDNHTYPKNASLFISHGFPILIIDKSIERVFFLKNEYYRKRLSLIKDDHFFENESERKAFCTYDYYFSYKERGNEIRFLNFFSGKTSYIYLTDFVPGKPSTNVVYFRKDTTYRNYLYQITNKYIFKFKLDSAVSLQKIFSIDSLVPGDVKDVVGCYEDNSWNCIFTRTNGIFFNYNSENYFVKKEKYPIDHCKYVGSSLDESSYWWNAVDRTLIKINDNKVTSIPIPGLEQVNEVLPVNRDTSLLVGFGNSTIPNFWVLEKMCQLVPAEIYKRQHEISKFVLYQPNDIYYISRYGFREMIRDGKDAHENVWDIDRYKNMAYDTLRKAIWAYTYSKVYIHNINGRDTTITLSGLRSLGLKRLEKVIMDRYGNIFLKDYDKLIMYDPSTGQHHELLKNYNLSEANLFLYNDMIIVTGRFGVVFSKIAGLQKMYKPYLYQNIKDAYYTYINGTSVNKAGVLLNTDKGAYQVTFPPKEELLAGNDSIRMHGYKFLVKYNNELYPLVNGDTLKISPKDRSVQFDVINPQGNGVLKFLYRYVVNGAWLSLNANELHVDQIAAGKYTDISVLAYDNVWRSDEITIHLYLVPYWWQTQQGKDTIYSLIAIFTLLLITASALITRKITINKNNKRNRRLELELNSIYAQINPHFIFNTLGSALLLIKQKKINEAYDHVSKFSHLLRAYIRSSRNRYIILEDEINNLHAYIQLQQNRFKDKFDYTITTDANIDTATIKIPSLLLQPIVENAINHGLFHKEDKGHLSISFQLKENMLICLIEDNGIGRQGSKTLYEKSHLKKESYGNKMITELVNIFNKYEGLSITINYLDKVDPSGTIVEIKIKNLQNG
ncbi:MAG: histidine kinase [Flavipsychrobacter sp.]|nr:histidine kinase [Flavipsychrobacter sp.]